MCAGDGSNNSGCATVSGLSERYNGRGLTMKRIGCLVAAMCLGLAAIASADTCARHHACSAGARVGAEALLARHASEDGGSAQGRPRWLLSRERAGATVRLLDPAAAFRECAQGIAVVLSSSRARAFADYAPTRLAGTARLYDRQT